MTIQHPATRAQNRAADPDNSTWVSANAGSGKTRVLTDRVARLLLQNVPPQKILCLTYTKAAASHMQNQLFRRLGEWSMLPDLALAERLAALGEGDEGETPQPSVLRHARTLFARALETPGGLKIQTIHSFCAALLRRFPLEAGVSPQFKEMDDRSGKLLRADVLDTLATGSGQPAFDGMAAYLSGDNPDRLMIEIIRQRDGFTPTLGASEIWTQLGLPAGYDARQYLSQVLPDWAADVLGDLEIALRTGKPTDHKNADILAALDLDTPTMETAIALETMFVFDSNPTKKSPDMAKTTFPTKDVRNAHPDLMEAVWHLMEGFQNEKARRLALLSAQKTFVLQRFAQIFLPEFDRRKRLHGWLDFDDLILKARALLSDSSMAQWVLFKLDGGIDHILVDEAQDTSPAQWAVIARLAEEFSTGASAREINRTLFVVGDEKQSIYSFQGADPNAFGQMRAHFDTRLAEAGSSLMKHDLLFSFRSSTAILRLVDHILQDPGSGFSSAVTHRAFYDALPGRVDLWPFLPNPEKVEKGQWFDPVDAPVPDDPSLALAGQIADAIGHILDSDEALPTSDGARKINAGDFLILVQRRSDLFHAIIKALKDRNLPVAGADRLKVGGELAVRDLAALLSFIATPEDDFSLAAAMRSPLLGLSEGDLFTLAQGRKGYLWVSLRAFKGVFPEVFDMVNDLMAQADFLRPYELLDRILTRHNGREHLVARLGHEAEDGIDAMLSQALQYEQVEPPSLTGFLAWMATDETDIKRQIDTASAEIRVMTVHGAKGLESPIVILPDTAKRKPPTVAEILRLPSGVAVWKGKRDDSPPPLRALMDKQIAMQEAERMRLLYVAITRAENWLIVCGAGDPGKEKESWYSHMALALADIGGDEVTFRGQPIQRFQPLDWTGDTGKVVTGRETAITTVPDWAYRLPPPAVKPVTPLAPSDLGGAKILAGKATVQATAELDEEAAMQRGSRIHKLLECLAEVSRKDRATLAADLLANDPDADIAALLAEVSGVLDNSDHNRLFSPGTLAEVAITACLGGRPLDGIIDRLLVLPDRVLAVDFKTNTVVPDGVADVPEGLLRQMGAYAAALAKIYPDRKIEMAILWTKTACLMPLPHGIVTDAFKRATIP